ncbi:MAG: hypothetical protein HC831_06280 [Chloroflexia bacterium]|nr:hypothetical protein [Chloroflexia bacterium]
MKQIRILIIFMISLSLVLSISCNETKESKSDSKIALSENQPKEGIQEIDSNNQFLRMKKSHLLRQSKRRLKF